MIEKSCHKPCPVPLKETIESVLQILKDRPEKNLLNVWADLMKNQIPKFSSLYIGRQLWPEDEVPEKKEKLSEEEQLASQILAIIKPLELENPVAPVLSLGGKFGTGLMTTAFGLEITDNPLYPGGIKGHLSIEELDKLEIPDPEKSGCFPGIKKEIDRYLAYTPDDFLIAFPDMQGPFNIACNVLGESIFFLMNDKPQKVHRFMEMVTDYYIGCHKLLQKWLPKKRWVPYIASVKRIAECSCNLISKDMYREFVAPYDKKIVEFFEGEVAIHPCSGPHVFEVTLEELSGVRHTEAGFVECAVAGSTSVDKAVNIVKGKPIILSAGDELIPGKEEETIKNHFGYLKKHPLMIFGSTGMYWKGKDDRFIINLHKRLDEYYYKFVKKGFDL